MRGGRLIGEILKKSDQISECDVRGAHKVGVHPRSAIVHLDFQPKHYDACYDIARAAWLGLYRSKRRRMHACNDVLLLFVVRSVVVCCCACRLAAGEA